MLACDVPCTVRHVDSACIWISRVHALTPKDPSPLERLDEPPPPPPPPPAGAAGGGGDAPPPPPPAGRAQASIPHHPPRPHRRHLRVVAPARGTRRWIPPTLFRRILRQ